MQPNMLMALIWLLVAWKPPEPQPNEWIKSKLEKAQQETITLFGEPLYCAPALYDFYENRSFSLAWDPAIADQLLTALKASDQEGLNPEDYHFPQLSALSLHPPRSAVAKAEHDLLLSDAFILFAAHLEYGKTNVQLTNLQKKEGPSVTPTALLEQALAFKAIGEALQSVTPQYPDYQQLKKALLAYRSLNAKAWPAIKEGSSIKQGMEDGRIPAIRERLVLLGDEKVENVQDSLLYDTGLAEAVISFQKRHGLSAEGSIGSETLRALNRTPGERIVQLEANMERWRWLPRDLGPYNLQVNIASYELVVIKNGKRVRTHKVIVGQPERPTPSFNSRLAYLVFNPTWTVPPGILAADVLPGVKKDSAYLERRKLIVLDREGRPINSLEIDWDSDAARAYTYRQLPGPDNALGVVKFMMPNTYNVYLHDTPTKSLFNKRERAFSSGCIRVQHALELAEFLLNDSINWSQKKIAKVVASQQTLNVTLKEQPLIYIFYHTAWVDEHQVIQFRKDIYDCDPWLIAQLQEKPEVFRQNKNPIK